jgi:glycerol kinase
MQLQADYLGGVISRPSLIETTAAGAAFLAGLGVGFWSDLNEIKAAWKSDQEFTPRLTKKQRSTRLSHWHEAVGRAMHHSEN